MIWHAPQYIFTYMILYPPKIVLQQLIPFESIWKSSLYDELHSLDRKAQQNKTSVPSFFNNFLTEKKLLKI